MVYQLLRDPYLDPDTGVMRNRLGITDADELAQREEDEAALATAKLLFTLRPTRWDPALLRLLYQQLFGQLYDWAGQYRTVEISKGTSRFAAAQHIPAQVEAVLAELEQERTDWSPGDDAVLDRLAHFYSELNAIHPFRDGNGRTIRLLLSLLANRYHWDLQWQHTTTEHNQHACALAFYGDETELREMMWRVALSSHGTSRQL